MPQPPIHPSYHPAMAHPAYPVQSYASQPPPPSQFTPIHSYGPSYDPMSMPDPRYAPQLPTPLSHPPGFNGKRLASAHPAEPMKKKQTKWTPQQDALIIELRGNGMKWEDISKHIEGRSAISCRLRFQNYLERRAEWTEEKKDKLARLYERFKKDMWEKIAKEMAQPWRAVESMHWQLGEDQMANRANVSVFHLAGQSSSLSSGQSERGPSVSPPAGVGMGYVHTHNHSLPQSLMPRSHPVSPEQTRMRRSSSSSSPACPPYHRRRADSARSVATTSSGGRMLLPPVGDIVGPPPPNRYTLPPVMMAGDPYRR